MGSQQCNACHETFPQPTLSPYAELTLTTHQQKQVAVIRKRVLRSAVILSEMERELEKRRRIDCIHIAKLYDYSIEKQPQLIHIELYYEYVPVTLKQRVSQWNDRQISESQLGNLLLGVETALLELDKAGIRHRLISMDTILCEKAVYKLLDNSMLTFLTGVDLMRQGDKNQLLNDKNLFVVNNEGTKPDYELDDDLFSLGLLAIVLVLKCDPQSLYLGSKKKWRLNQTKISKGLRLIELNYDSWVWKKVQCLLQKGLKQSQSGSATGTNQHTPNKSYEQ